MAFSKRNRRTTRPTAPRWKAHIGPRSRLSTGGASRPVMRNGRDARACPRHMRPPTRSPAL
eukprot:scaffold52009_cov84-Phaeocystis_antarctica.AAC.1